MDGRRLVLAEVTQLWNGCASQQLKAKNMCNLDAMERSTSDDEVRDDLGEWSTDDVSPHTAGEFPHRFDPKNPHIVLLHKLLVCHGLAKGACVRL
jgi:hypothetical protein